MGIQWDFKIDLNRESILQDIEKEYEISIPEEVKAFIIEHNAASPTPNTVEINGIERVYDATLSFNDEEDDATTFRFAMQIVNKPGYIPFAQDPFGNFFCIDSTKSLVAFYNHEEDFVEDTEVNLATLLKMLH